MKASRVVVVVLGLAVVTGCKKTDDKAGGTAPAKTEPATTEPAKATPVINAADYQSGISECDDLVKTVLACPKLSPDAQSALLGTATMAKGQKDAAADMKKSVGEVCAEKAKQQEGALKAAGC